MDKKKIFKRDALMTFHNNQLNLILPYTVSVNFFIYSEASITTTRDICIERSEQRDSTYRVVTTSQDVWLYMITSKRSQNIVNVLYKTYRACLT